jgi:hypothetical protein
MRLLQHCNAVVTAQNSNSSPRTSSSGGGRERKADFPDEPVPMEQQRPSGLSSSTLASLPAIGEFDDDDDTVSSVIPPGEC